jgi:type I restriction enzyme S subunit
LKGPVRHLPLRRIASGGGFFCDGDWIETPFITDDGVRLVQTGNVGVGVYREQGFRFVSEQTFADLRCTEVLPGDVLICRLADPVGRSCIAPNLGCKMITSVDVAILRPSPGVADARYLNYFFGSSGYLEFVGSIARGGTRQRISREQLGEVPVRLPLLREQRAIADYLDAETARIDALITKKRRLIDLVDERTEAEIFHAVTRGGVGPRELKPSRLSWVEEIPLGWGTPPVSANFELQLGKMLNAEAAAGPSQFPYLRNVNVQWDHISLLDLATMHFDEQDRLRCLLRTGDLLVCEGGEVGRAAIWNGEVAECYFQKAIHRVRPRRGADGRFLMYCLRAAAKRSVFAVEGNLSTIVHLTGEQLRAHRFPWPPRDEQACIVQHLDIATLRAKELTANIARQIDLLLERRQALITAAVTGELEISAA